MDIEITGVKKIKNTIILIKTKFLDKNNQIE